MSEREGLPDLHPAVRSVVEEVRAEVPVVDWSRVEARLFDEHGAVRDAAPPSSRGKIARVVGAFALAASFAIGLLAPAAARSTGVAATITRAPIFAGDRVVHVGDELVAPEGGLVLHSEGRVDVRLVPGSKARLVDDGERIRFALEEGAIAASVVPVPGGEPFAIDALGHRVAVHGTKLYVEVQSGAVVVAVAEGNAVVGAAHGDGRTEGAIVPAGAIGRFEGFGAEVARDPVAADELVSSALHPSTIVSVAEPAPIAPANDAPAATNVDTTTDAPAPAATVAKLAPSIAVSAAVPASSPAIAATVAPSTPVPAPAPEGLSADAAAPGLARIVGVLQSCVPRTTTNVQFSVTTTMTLSVDPSGAVIDASFDDSPLSPEIRACALGKISAVKFPAAPGKSTLSRRVVLGTP